MRILIKVKDDKLLISTRKRLNNDDKNIINTNLISNDEIFFTDDYIKDNPVVVSSFLNVLIKNYSVNTISFQNMDVAEAIINILNKFKGIKTFYFESDEVLTYTLCEKIIKCSNLKFVSANYIPAYMFEMLDKYNIIPESRDEVLFTSNFMQINSLTNYATIFYKYMVYLEFPFTTEDMDDFSTFCGINKNLRVIHVNKPNRFNLEEIISILKANKKRKIKVYIHGDVQEPDVIEYLKKYNKTLKKKYQIILKLQYSDKYIRENIAKQTNNNILRMCSYLIIVLVISCISFIAYDSYKAMLKTSRIQNKLQEVIKATDATEIKKEIEEIEEKNEGKVVVNDLIAKYSTQVNPDIVGFLTVNNTNIDYPVPQASDNDYYLNHDIMGDEDPGGWVFLDYTNDIDVTDDNTVIYGHNRYGNGVMFGTLNKTLRSDWYLNEENQIITYYTLFGTYYFKIFSIYITPTDNTYIQTNIASKSDKVEFFNNLAAKSIYNFGVTFDEDDKIITLSTCQSDVSRLVVHGVLIDVDNGNTTEK